MARPSYGTEVKKRSHQLLALLLDYANDELDCDETALNALRPHIQTHWQTEQRLIVRTKVRFLENLSKIAGDSPLSGEQIKESLRRFADFLEILEDNRPNRSGSETWHFTLKLWYKRRDRTINLQRFVEEWEHRRPLKSKLVKSHSEEENPEDNWWQWCRDCLEAQHYQRLTTNPLMVSDRITFNLSEVYVPLGLVEHQYQEQRYIDTTPEKGAQIYESLETKENQIFSLEQFLEKLKQPEVPKRVAIVGEPGSGKTTLLQNIANWLLENQALPIWIFLADLQGATIEQYLLNDWLKTAIKKVIVSPELQIALGEQFEQGRVWLLLDAVDEMATDASVALAVISRQLRGWVSRANVILTSRLNVWNSGKNALETFETYRNLTFSYGDINPFDQIGQFIQRWFHNQPELGKSLRVELDKPERKRIRDTVKNPLRLALLCRIWWQTQGTLPQTKATLYQQFVQSIYEWKQDIFPTSLVQREQLNKALENLALAAFIQLESKFRLPQSLVYQVFGEPALELLTLALQLGWLNQVGAISGAKVYAFYHPTFQEYFAAQAIVDWRFFLSEEIEQKPSELTPTYLNPPVFSPHWREVILLWLGRDNIPLADKVALMQALVEFNDGCGGFYSYQTYFLAAAGLAEFPEYPQANKIIAQLLCWRFGKFNQEQQTWQCYPSPVVEGARVALLQTDRTKAIAALENFIQSTENPFAVWNAAYSLGKTFAPGNAIAITAITELFNKFNSKSLRLQIAQSLGRIDPGNAIAISTLTELITSTQQESLRRKAAYCLLKLEEGNLLAINTLEKLIVEATDCHVKIEAAKSLLQLKPSNVVAINAIPNYQKPVRQTRRFDQAKRRDEQKAIINLEQRLSCATDASTRLRLAYKLGQLHLGHPQASETLIQLLDLVQSSELYRQIGANLREILTPNQLPVIVTKFKSYCEAVETDRLTPQVRECYKLLWYCAQQMPYKCFHTAWYKSYSSCYWES